MLDFLSKIIRDNGRHNRPVWLLYNHENDADNQDADIKVVHVILPRLRYRTR